MAKSERAPKPKKTAPREADTVIDEPGAEERFLRGVRKALNTPPTKRRPKNARPKKG